MDDITSDLSNLLSLMEYQIYWSHLTPEAQEAFIDIWHPNIELNPLAIIDVDPDEILYNIESETDRKVIARFAKQAENDSNWVLAERLWIKLHNTVDAEACRTIIEATEKGDYFRKRVESEAGPEPSKDNPFKWATWYNAMSKIYREVYYGE